MVDWLSSCRRIRAIRWASLTVFSALSLISCGNLYHEVKENIANVSEAPDDSNDPSGSIAVSPLNLTVTEGGGESSYSVVLSSEPLETVTVTVSGGPEITANPTSLSFGPSEWDVPQSVSVSAADDGATEGIHYEQVSHTSSSGDSEFDGVPVPQVDVEIRELYSLTFDGNSSTGGSAPTDSNTYYEGETVSLPDNPGGLIRLGYTFSGWNTAADGSGASYAPGGTASMPVGALTLYAEWGPAFAGGDGTAGNPFQISKADHLNNVRTQLGANFLQTADISLARPPWDVSPGFEPIGGAATNFYGSYDGDFHRIDGMYIQLSSGAGLFGFVNAATISRMALTGVNISANYTANGGLIADTATGGGPTTVTESYVTGTITSSTNSAGGIIGRARQDVLVDQSFANVDLSNASANLSIGGIISVVETSVTATIRDSYALGTINTGSNEVGALVGTNNGAVTIERSYGGVSDGTTLSGTGTPTVTASFNDADDDGADDGTADPMTLQTTFTSVGWDFTSIWTINGGVSYPYHQWYTGTAPLP